MSEPERKLIEAMTRNWPDVMTLPSKLSSWNYRIVESKENDEPIFSLHEVYYEEDGKTITNWTGPILDGFESVSNLLRELVLMGRAGGWPVIQLDDLKSKAESTTLPVVGPEGC